MAAVLLQPGVELVPGYRLRKRIGEGGFGQVWEAESDSGFLAALKLVARGRLDEGQYEREKAALDAIKAVRHPNLIAVFNAWQTEDHLIIAMELAERSLWHRLREAQGAGQSGIPRDELLDYLGEAARGLDYLNGLRPRGEAPRPAGIQHRDIKPQNILLMGGGVKVADFGLATLLEHSVTERTFAGTFPYAAPECFKKQVASRSDQYSLAVTYCQLRGGRLPFEGDALQLMYGHVNEPPDLTMLPAPERPAVARALAKDPRERWPSCRDLVEALGATGPEAAPRPAAVTLASAATPTPGPQATPPPAQPAPPIAPPATTDSLPPVRRTRRWLLAVALLLLPGAAALAWWGRALLVHPAAAEPSLALDLERPGEVILNPGWFARIPVRVRRAHVSGPVRVAGLQLPPGVSAEPVDIPDGRDEGEVVVRAEDGVGQGTWELRLTAVAGGLRAEGAPVRLTVAPAPPLGITLPDAVAVRPGETTTFRVVTTRQEPGAVELRFDDLPRGITVHPAAGPGLPQRAGEYRASFEVTAAGDVAPGRGVVVRVVASNGPSKGRADLRLTVKSRPALTLGTPGPVLVGAGARTRFRLTLQRDGFDDAVVLRFEGVPAGLAVNGGKVLTVPAGQKEVDVDLAAEAGARPGDLSLKVVGTGGKARQEAPLAVRVVPPPPSGPGQPQGGTAGGRRGGRGFGRGGVAGLLTMQKVQEELRLSDEQAEKVKKVAADMQDRSQRYFQEVTQDQNMSTDQRTAKTRENAAKVREETFQELGGVLKPGQTRRLKQLELQQRLAGGPRVFLDPDVEKALKLTGGQKEALKTRADDYTKELRELILGGRNDETRKKMDDLRKQALDSALKALTDEQKRQWGEMTGAPFNFGP